MARQENCAESCSKWELIVPNTAMERRSRRQVIWFHCSRDRKFPISKFVRKGMKLSGFG
jgi:hypothetical protein